MGSSKKKGWWRGQISKAVLWVAENGEPKREHLIKYVFRQAVGRPVSDSQICTQLDGFLKSVGVHGIYREQPEIDVIGPYELSDEAAKCKLEMSLQPRNNDSHAILCEEPIWRNRTLRFVAQELYFTDVQALRELEFLPPLLSGNAVIVCPEARVIVVHHRDRKESVTHPEMYHTPGGGYMHTPRPGEEHCDAGQLHQTVVRELREELRCQFEPPIGTPAIAMTEMDTGFVQFCYLGVPIRESTLKQMKENWEGKKVEVPFDDLRDFMKQAEKWVPTGWAAIVAWLGMGAPGGGSLPRFRGRTATSLYHELINDESLAAQLVRLPKPPRGPKSATEPAALPAPQLALPASRTDTHDREHTGG